MLDLLYIDGGGQTRVHQWDYPADGGGRPGCRAPGLLANDPASTAALQRATAVDAMETDVRAYEAAQALVARGEPDNGQPKQIPDPAAVRPEDVPEDWTAPLIDNPDWALLPRTVETIGVDGQPQTAPEPRWQAYDAAGAIIAAASPTTLALARWRSGAPSESEAEAHAAWAQAKADALAALASEAAKPLAHDPRPDRQFSADRVKTDCGLRIYAVASDNAQKNMLATIVAGGMSDADKALFAAGVQWIAAMQAACRRMIADADPQFADDSKWPAVPAGVAELAARF